MKEKKPEIRFKGYKDSWVEKPFGEVFDTLSNNTLSRDKLNYDGGIIQDVHYGDVLIKFGEILDADKEQLPYITDCSEVTGTFLRDGDVIIADTAEDETVGKCTELCNVGDKKILSGLHTIPCRPKEEFASGFLGYSLNSDKYHHKLLPLMQGIKVTSISKSGFDETKILYPISLNEQRNIVNFLRSLTEKVEAEQEICKKLEIIKKAMIEKLFPKNGDGAPQIRFAGYKGAWNSVPLREIADKVTAKNIGTKYLETFTNSAELGVISQTDFFEHEITKLENIDGYYVVERDAFVYNPRISASAPVGPINRNKLKRTGVISPLYTVFKTHDVDLQFLEWYFKSRAWHKFMYYNGDSGARADRFSIKDDLFFEMPIAVPELAEQKKIGELMENIDRLLVLHQNKVQMIINIKNTCTRKMFV